MHQGKLYLLKLKSEIQICSFLRHTFFIDSFKFLGLQTLTFFRFYCSDHQCILEFFSDYASELKQTGLRAEGALEAVCDIIDTIATLLSEAEIVGG